MTSLDTPPAAQAPEAPQPPPRQGPIGRIVALIRNTWRSLTSMRTALVLLFLLALAAIPGALLPQRSLNRTRVQEYLDQHTVIGPIFDRLQLFDVFSSVWFTAIYVLLFVSLVGCILPRTVAHYKAMRTDPVAAPRRLTRLPNHATLEWPADGSDPVDVAAKQLRGWRKIRRTEASGATTLSAEKGYSREFGNLIFHISLVGLLIAVAAGKLIGYEGNVVVIADPDGPGTCSTSPAAFDTFRAGNMLDGTGLNPVCVKVDTFQADYLDSGQAKMFTSQVRYQTGAELSGDTWHDATLRVNDPLRVGGDRIYLQGHGFAPTFTVTWPNGESRTETVPFEPTDLTRFLSSGALRFDPPAGMYPDADQRRGQQIAIEGLFAPTALFHDTLLTSGFPAMTDPAVAVDVYRGDSGLDTGFPQSIFSLNQELINQGRLVQQARVNLRPGETVTLDDGTTVRFDGAKEFVNLQFSYDPAQIWVLVFALSALGGLIVSLMIKRRRIWVRAHPADADGMIVVELGGLARTDQAGWGDEFERVTRRISGHRDTSPGGALQDGG
ncbi:cytochrome c biogenesis protein ResB [Millisia brevis]|uniref:cytochrome c biogenesis protein ResB n=1 Tax=Millisia brevis TaxID=264148 RepID=UPI00082C9F8D|nr:cytochrome c biogenesis protein ResB [Millisia brevis]